MNTKIKLPRLHGTPKQIEWAEKLRAEVLAYVLENRAEIVARIRALSAEFHDIRVNNIIAQVKDETARKRKLEKEAKRYEERLTTDVFGDIIKTIQGQPLAASWIYHFRAEKMTIDKAVKMQSSDALDRPKTRADYEAENATSRMVAAKIRRIDGRIGF